MTRQIYCTECRRKVEAQALNGSFIYSHRLDLYEKLFFVCPECGNYVGTHADGRPLGTIPTPGLRKWRNEVHRIIDEYWLPNNKTKRKELYADLSEFLGRRYHTGELNTIAECRSVIEYYLRKYER